MENKKKPTPRMCQMTLRLALALKLELPRNWYLDYDFCYNTLHRLLSDDKIQEVIAS